MANNGSHFQEENDASVNVYNSMLYEPAPLMNKDQTSERMPLIGQFCRHSTKSIQSLSSEILQLIFIKLPIDHIGLFLTCKYVYLVSPLASIESAQSYLKLRMIHLGCNSVWDFLPKEVSGWTRPKTLPFNLHVNILYRMLKSQATHETITNYKIIKINSSKHAFALVKALVDSKVLMYKRSNRLLCWACQLNYEEVVKFCLDYPLLDPSENDNAALTIAHRFRFQNIVRQLVKDPRHKRALGGHNYFNLLCQYGIHEELQGWFPDDSLTNFSFGLELAVGSGHLKVINTLLLDFKVDPNQRNVLAYAASLGRMEIVERLLEDPRVYPSMGNNAALIGAAKENDIAVIKRLLLDPRINVTYNNNRLFIHSCRLQLLSLAQELLQDGRADPTAQNNEALVTAIINSQIEVLQLLLADLRIKSEFEKQARYFLSISKSAQVFRLLLQHCRVGVLSEDCCSNLLTDSIVHKRDQILLVMLQDPQFDLSVRNINMAALISSVTAQNVTFAKILFSDKRVVTQIRTNSESFDREMQRSGLSPKFRIAIAAFLMENGLSDLALIFSVRQS
ncbi:hypothetical protein BCR33DRAFT_739561 [Rhizoclosmatium globosum]|uniref:Uncharacterized protein n=1 Tax=Rhizoclosmatium globosum TaxID=329046 RepID=A0A1Y2C3Q4_9FUNG|nr:hypothetical protein BCR33DRAFT_739561 [Rhizoclosmatium globosum]|eukprot:ORY41524.1 hypothetical protein BCR33DRAFT_739561 [Rhizoclosmatium globosum]